jgi:hypothetical protein
MSVNTEVHADWTSHPLVARAIEETDGTAIQVLGKLHQVLTDIDDRFPGVGIHDLMNTHRATRGPKRRVRNALRKAGVCEADILLVIPAAE